MGRAYTDNLLLSNRDLRSFADMERAIFVEKQIRVAFCCDPAEQPNTHHLRGSRALLFFHVNGLFSNSPGCRSNVSDLRKQLQPYATINGVHIKIVIISPKGTVPGGNTYLDNIRFEVNEELK
jgi:hypothetical protein